MNKASVIGKTPRQKECSALRGMRSLCIFKGILGPTEGGGACPVLACPERVEGSKALSCRLKRSALQM